tara:strand:+ start:535 stop:765 length:231 start_codon:yes stop_codon:yes gene_type:complete
MEKKISSWEWGCSSKEAVEHEKNCKDSFNCETCIAILSTSVAMEEFGTEMISEEEPDEMHPLFDHIMETFNGRQVK